MILKFPIIERVFIKECGNETIQFSEIALEGKMKSNFTIEYGKKLTSGNVTINSSNMKNKDSIISGGSHC